MKSSGEADPGALDALSAEQQDRLADILDQYVAALEAGQSPSAQELTARHPDLAPAIRAHLESLRFLHRAAAEFEHDRRPTPVIFDPPEKRLGDYLLLREIGRGGMGVVYEAQQISLDRHVAVKVLPFAAVLDQKQIARFANEARAAAQLHHPNIVPVYSVGCERGVHYYAMQYIEGQPLDRAIRQLRQSARTTPDDAPAASPPAEATSAPPLPAATPTTVALWDSFTTAREIHSRDYAQTVARLGLQAARALQHAHEYGIVHRDVKPSNLLLDARGKLWITDFGLARFQTGTALTMSGDLLGTVCYMSPEQAGGKAQLVDHRTDIYSLGITLYELLTLHDAYADDERHRVLRRIVEEEPRAIRQLNPAAPADLETIIHKAISKAREHRYDTAEALADDLQRFLDGQPTLARPPGAAERLGRWASRHRAAVRATVGFMAVALVGLAMSLAVIANEHAKTRRALSEREASLERADAYFRQARRVVDQFGAQMAEQLAGVPGGELLRRQVLHDTLDYYTHFVAQADDDPALRRDLGLTWSRIGSLTEQEGDWAKALAAHQQAEAVLADLARTDPDQRADLALCHNNIGLALTHLGRAAEARAAFHAAIRLQGQLRAEQPGDARLQADLALSHSNLGLLEDRVGRPDAAAAAFQTAISSQEQLVARWPDEPKHQASLAGSYNHLAMLASKTDPEQAVEACRRALALQRGLMARHPDVLDYRADAALSCNNLGALHGHLRQHEEARQAYDEALRLQEELVRRSPATIRYRSDLAVTLNNLGRLRADADEAGEAAQAFLRARDTLEQLVSQRPADLSYRSGLGGVLNNLGMVREQQGQFEAAATAYREAIGQQRRAVAAAPQVDQFRLFLDTQYANLTRVLRALGDGEAAAQAARTRVEFLPHDPRRLYAAAEDLVLVAECDDVPASTRTALIDQSLTVLGRALALGYDSGDALERGPQWNTLRADPRFQSLLGR